MKYLTKKLIELGLMEQVKKPSATYTLQSSGTSELNVERFINGQAYWKQSSQVHDNTYQHKKIVIHDYRALYTVLDTYRNLFFILFQEHFIVYVRVSPGKFKEAKNFEEFISCLSDFQLTTTENLLEELSIQDDIQPYFIFDHVERIRIIDSLKGYLQFREHANDASVLEISPRIQFLSDENFNAIVKLAQSKCFTSLQYTSQIKNKFNISITLKNTWDELTLKRIFLCIMGKLEQQDEFLETIYFPLVTEIKIDSKTITELDLTPFTSLKKLTLILHPQFNSIIGLENLSQIEELTIKNQPFDINLSPLKNLKLVTFDNCKQIDIEKVLFNCQNIQNLNIGSDDENSIIRLPALPSLEELCIATNKLHNLDTLFNCPNLRKLSIVSLSIKENLSTLIGFTTLDLTQVTQLEQLDMKLKVLSPSELKIIGMEKCTRLESVSISTSPHHLLDLSFDVTNLSKLDTLRIFNYKTSINGVNNLTQLKNVYTFLRTFTYGKELFRVNKFNQLETLEIISCDKFDQAHANIKLLRISNCQTISIEQLPSLETCFFNQIGSLSSNDFSPFKKLKSVSLNGIKDIAFSTLDFSSNQELVSLEIICCHPLSTLKLPTNYQNLRKLHIAHCDELTLPDNIDLSSIEEVKIINCKKIPTLTKFSVVCLPNHFLTANQKLKLPSIALLPPIKQFISSSSSHKNIVDTNTYVPPQTKVTVQKIFSSDDDTIKPPSPSFYRNSIIVGVDLDENENIILVSSNKNDTYEEITLSNNNVQPKHAMTGTEQVAIRPGGKVSLTGLSSCDQLVALSHHDRFSIHRSTKTGQYFLSTKNNTPSYHGLIQYKIIHDKNYFQEAIHKFIAKNIEIPSLPDALLNAIKMSPIAKFKRYKRDHEMVNWLAAYCRSFTNETLSDKAMSLKPIDRFISMIIEKKGACRHRAYAFMVLCHFFGIPARIPESRIHDYVEVPIQDKKTVKWVALNLVGAYVNIVEQDIPSFDAQTNKRKRDNHEDDEKIKFQKLNPLDEMDVDAASSEWDPYFLPDEKWLLECNQFGDVVNRIKDHPMPILFRTSNITSSWNYYAALHRSLSMNDQSVVYIDTPDDIHAFYAPIKVYDTTRKKVDFPFAEVDGPLIKLIKSGQGTIIVNWSTFSANERAIYKSMMDRPATLNGHVLSEKIRINGLLCQDMDANDVFLSRCHEITLPPNLTPAQSDSIMACDDNNNNTLTINLYRSQNWEQYLLHHVFPDGSNMIVEKGDLIKAMKNGLTLEVINPPTNSESFNQLQHRLSVERAIVSNGKYITAKNGFRFVIKQEEIKLQPPAFIHFHAENPPLTNGRRFYLHHDNYSQLFKGRYINKDGHIHPKNGWLSDAKSDDQFILTESLSDEEWQRMFDVLHTRQGNNQTDIHFYATYRVNWPFIKLEKREAQVPIQLKSVSDCLAFPYHIHIKSNDIHFIVKHLQSTLHLPTENIFYSTHKNSWTALIEQVDLTLQDGQLRAIRRKSPLWKKIKKGETVILYGDLSQEDYASLQTLFVDPPYLYINGKRIEPKGKLIWISHTNTHLQTKNTPHYLYQSTLSDYESFLKTEIKDINEVILQQLRTFFSSIEKLKPNEPFYPSASLYTYAKYKQMYEHAASGISFKPILSYHYRKKSDAYALINDSHHSLFNAKSQCLPPSGSMDRAEKQQSRLLNAIHHPSNPLIYLIGESGTGKTSAAKKVAKKLKVPLYKNIFSWLTSKGKGPYLLLLDEINLDEPGKWEFLRGLLNDPPIVYYDHQFHILTQQHKVIMTGNPLHYPGRRFHSILWEHAYLIWFSPFQTRFIQSTVLKMIEKSLTSPLTIDMKAQLEPVPELIAKAYHFLRENTQRAYEITLRDIKNISSRLVLLKEAHPEYEWKTCATRAIYEEMSGILLNNSACDTFKSYLETISGAWPNDIIDHPKDDDHVIIPKENYSLWQLIRDDLTLREKRISLNKNSLGKLGILLEGPSGIGKSTLLMKALEEAGLKQDALNTQARYYQITTGSIGVEKSFY